MHAFQFQSIWQFLDCSCNQIYGTFRMQNLHIYAILQLRNWYHWTQLWSTTRQHTHTVTHCCGQFQLHIYLVCANEWELGCAGVQMYLIFFPDEFELNDSRYLCLWRRRPLLFLFAMRFDVVNDAVGKKNTYIFSCRIRRSSFISACRCLVYYLSPCQHPPFKYTSY